MSKSRRSATADDIDLATLGAALWRAKGWILGLALGGRNRHLYRAVDDAAALYLRSAHSGAERGIGLHPADLGARARHGARGARRAGGAEPGAGAHLPRSYSASGPRSRSHRQSGVIPRCRPDAARTTALPGGARARQP